MSLPLGGWVLLGALVGSFLNVCVGRWPLGLSVVQPRSRCPRCLVEIAWYDNIPVLSWLLLRARCRACALPISWRYPAVEIAVAVLWGAAAAFSGGQVVATLHGAGLATVLLGIMLTDAEHFLIPDFFSLAGLVIAFGGIGLAVGLDAPLIRGVPFATAVLGACVGAGVITLLGWFGAMALDREAMGDGDAPLMAVLGTVLGPWGVLLTLFVACALGVAWHPVSVLLRPTPAPAGDQEDDTPGGAPLRTASPDDLESAPVFTPEPGMLPFGVLLIPAAFIVAFAGDRLVGWYLSFAGLR